MFIETTVQFEQLLKKTGKKQLSWGHYGLFNRLRGMEDIEIVYEVLMEEAKVALDQINLYKHYVIQSKGMTIYLVEHAVKVLVEVIRHNPNQAIAAKDIPMYYYELKMQQNKFSNAIIECYRAYVTQYLDVNLYWVEQYVNILVKYLKANHLNNVGVKSPSWYYNDLMGFSIVCGKQKGEEIEEEVLACGITELCHKRMKPIDVKVIKNLERSQAMTFVKMALESDEPIEVYPLLNLTGKELGHVRKALKDREYSSVPLLIDLERLIKHKKSLSNQVKNLL